MQVARVVAKVGLLEELVVLQAVGLGQALALEVVGPGRNAGFTSMGDARRGRSATWPMWGLWK